MAKLSTLQFSGRADTGAALVIMDPLNPAEPLRGADGAPATITLRGIDSPTAKRLQYEQRAAASVAAAARASEDGSDAALYTVTVDDIETLIANTIALLVALTVDWTGFEDDAGAPLPCTPEHARALYAQCEPIREQATAFLNDRARFFAASATPSAPSPRTDSGSIAA
jgi:hypothetical protein